MGKNLTLKDLAQKLGLSTSTVSRALQNNPAISDDTRLRVNKLAKKIGYYPDALAKSLKNKKSYTIGVIVPEISHFFFSSVIDGIEDVTYKDGYTILVTKSNEDFEREVLNLESLISNRVAGVIASISQNTKTGKHFNNIINRGIPLVLFDRVLDDLDVHKIVGDDFEKVYEMVNHLIDSGYQNIAYLAGPSHLNITMNRVDGYKKALIDNNIELMDGLIMNINLNENDGFEGAKTLIREFPKIDAICCVNDPVALGVYKYLNKVGIKIPDKVGVTGFSNNPSSETINPPMTTVDQQGYKMGRKAAKILLQKINNESIDSLDKIHIIEGKLIIRDSSRKNNLEFNS
ncbi:MAG: LacI family DNA-binding transcriptional regulator [Candidatus Marinimicrobia bacterium]|nr:LacI family DNA-binding transcriptional regulator [Candidatus Neomarinimicrobiota bacterium]